MDVKGSSSLIQIKNIYW